MTGIHFSGRLRCYYLVIIEIDIPETVLSQAPEEKLESSAIITDAEVVAAEAQEPRAGLMYIVVPMMLLFSSAIMATAWLGHLRFKEDLTFLMATLFAWLLVLPEYALNILALRLGYRKFTGGQMGAFRLCTGVVCIAFVSHYVLGEQLTTQKILGFVVMAFSMILISSADNKDVEQ